MRFVNRILSCRGSYSVRSIRARGNWSRETRLLSTIVGASVLSVIATGCAKRIPAPVGGQTDSPHVGWVIMSGDADNPDRDFVCQSNPPSECVVPADRPESRVLGHVHFYYHAAATETTYTGSNRIGFFEKPHEVNPDITVKPGESPGNQSVSYFVSSKPGKYTMSIAVVATSAQTGRTENIRDQVSVMVK